MSSNNQYSEYFRISPNIFYGGGMYMKNCYILKFYYDQEHFITQPVKSSSLESLSKKITDAYNNDRTWISFPTKNKQTRILGTEQITVNLKKVNYFKIEVPTKAQLERFLEDDFFEWEE